MLLLRWTQSMCRLHPSTHEVRILNRVYCSPLVLTAPVGAISLHKCPADAPGASNQSQATEQEIGLLGRLPCRYGQRWRRFMLRGLCALRAQMGCFSAILPFLRRTCSGRCSGYPQHLRIKLKDPPTPTPKAGITCWSSLFRCKLPDFTGYLTGTGCRVRRCLLLRMGRCNHG